MVEVIGYDKEVLIKKIQYLELEKRNVEVEKYELERKLSELTELMKKIRDEVEKTKEGHPLKYDIAISFAGEDRKIAKNLAKALLNKDIDVFYDEFYRGMLWGKHLKKFFQKVYGPKTRFVVVLISKYYPVKDWTDFEFSIVREEAKKRKAEFILPVKLDDTKILGIHRDIAYLDYKKEGIDGIVGCILEKINT